MRQSKKIKKKPKLDLGAFIGQNKDSISGIGNMIGSSIQAGPKPSRGASVGGSALQGAALGTEILPGWGTVIGGVLGAGKGWLDADANEKAQKDADMQLQATDDRNLLNNAKMKNGGRLLAKNLNVQEGGRLNAISDNAVEVQANNPNETDSVELNDAYVDNNEVIDRQNRVFSDSMFLPNGKSIAKEAKRLEKQKAEDTDFRFKAANERIETKLDGLFNYQEASKQEGMKKKNFNTGGRLSNKNNSVVLPNVSSLLDNSSLISQGVSSKLLQMTMAKGGKGDFKQGGRIGKNSPALYYTPPSNILGKKRLDLGGDFGPGDDITKPSPRAQVDAQLLKNYPGRALDELDTHNVPSTPGVPDTPATWAVRRGYPPSIQPQQIQASLPQTSGFQDVNKMILDKTQKKMGGKLKRGYAKGGVFDLTDPTTSMKGPNLSYQIPQTQGQSQPNTAQGFNSSKAFTAAATFAPNIVNQGLQARLQGPPAPQLEQATRLDRIDPSSQYAQLDTDTNQVNALLTRNTAQAGNLTSALGSNLARKIQGRNQIAGQTQQLNAGIQGNEAFMNTQKQARNADRLTNQKMQNVEFSNKKAELTSQNVSNLSQKLLMQGKEKNMMNLDATKYGILMQQYNNLPPAMKAKYNNVFDFYNSTGYKEGNKKGGRIRKNANRGNGVISDDPDNLKMGGRLNKRTMKNSYC